MIRSAEFADNNFLRPGISESKEEMFGEYRYILPDDFRFASFGRIIDKFGITTEGGKLGPDAGGIEA